MNRKKPQISTSQTGSHERPASAPPSSPRNSGLGGCDVIIAHQMIWQQRFTDAFGPWFGEKYGRAFMTACMHPDHPCVLSDFHMKNMKIVIGHRKVIDEMIERLRYLDKDAEEEEERKKLLDNCAGLTIEISVAQIVEVRPLGHTCLVLKCGLKWYDYEGEAENYDSFLTFIETTVIRKGSSEELPEHFIRAFWNNKPMPFSAKAHTKSGRPCAILLLRLPSVELVNDPLNVKDSTMATMTNRMILVYKPRDAGGGTLITYHKDPTSTMPWLDEMKKESVWDHVEHLSREKFLMHFVFQSMISSRDVLESYRKQLDALIEIRVSKSPTAVVEWMNLIARQAQVLKRCLFGDKTAVSELCEALALEGQATLQILSDLSDVAEEIEGNAMDAVKLRMGLVGFRAQENMKLFTYVAAVTAPLAVLTGWFGMNFDFMPELHFEESYPVFAAFAVGVTIFMVCVMAWKNRDTGSSVIDQSLHAMVAEELTVTTDGTMAVMKALDANRNSRSGRSNSLLFSHKSDLNETFSNVPLVLSPERDEPPVLSFFAPIEVGIDAPLQPDAHPTHSGPTPAT